MRLPNRGSIALVPAVLVAALSVSPFARAQTEVPPPLPELPSTPAPSAQPAAPPAPPSTPPPPPPVVTSPTPSSATAEPVILAVPQYRHQGFYLAAGGGGGFFSARGSGPLGDASVEGGGQVAYLGIGGTVATGLVLGGSLRTWIGSATFEGGPPITATTTYYANGTPTKTTLTLSGHAHVATVEIGVMLDWFPNPEKGWHVGGSVGLVGMSLSDDAATQSTAGGVGGSIFGGYQWWLGPSWSLGLGGVLSIAGVSHLDDSNQNDVGYKLTPFGIGLQSQLLYY